MSYVLEEEIAKQGIPRDAKFTPDLQDKLILGRISRFRGVTPEILKKEGMSTRVMDMLAPEFASFPYSEKGNRSYYGQPVKSPQAIQNAYKKSQQVYGTKLKQIESQSLAKPSPSAPKPERWAIDPRGWFGMRDGGIVGEIPKQTKATDISPLESYPSYSPESGESMRIAIQPVIIKVPTPVGGNRSTMFPVAVGVNNSMSNLSNLSQG